MVGDGRSEPEVTFVWREHGGPPVVAPVRQGFGSRVIKDVLANDLGGKVQLSYEPAGYICELKTARSNLPA